jgi:hypothetical protein
MSQSLEAGIRSMFELNLDSWPWQTIPGKRVMQQPTEKDVVGTRTIGSRKNFVKLQQVQKSYKNLLEDV